MLSVLIGLVFLCLSQRNASAVGLDGKSCLEIVAK